MSSKPTIPSKVSPGDLLVLVVRSSEKRQRTPKGWKRQSKGVFTKRAEG